MRLFKDCTIGKFTAVFALSGALFFIFPYDAPAQKEDASSSVTVITSEEIAVEKPASVIDLLRQKVGVDVSGSEISMRGVKGVVVVVDGVTQNTIPSSLKPEDVERIEILRGAASSRYGASAMGGAVVMATKRGEKKRTVDLIQGYGSFGRRYTKAIGSGSKGDWDFRISLEENVT
ncbi:MAG: TonB-dependent receptor plug domain-containing protein, partial [Deltaproteobacteria bacterium]|nr:TonB-dependent receptor plug domain-containing protein [Deltaproteobacteria bacterium]